MTVGLPGTGIGGMFYLLSALAMPFTEAYRYMRGRSSSPWRVMAAQMAITGGILAAMGATAWLVGAVIAASRRVLPAGVIAHELPAGGVLRAAMLALSLGTLATVLIGVELARLWVHRHPRRSTPGEMSDAPEPHRRGEPRVASGGAGRRPLLLLVTVATVHAHAVVAQSASRRGNHLARADSALGKGDSTLAAREYAAVLVANPNNSRVTYRLAELRRQAPDEALRLFQRYVTLEPSDPWGYMAVGDVLADVGRYAEGLRAYESALRLAPGERDAVIGRAHLLAQAGRIDAAVGTYQQWLVAHPEDAAAWRDLARQELRAGRPGDAAGALQRAQTIEPSPVGAERLTTARAAAAPSVAPLTRGSRDSDGNTTLRVGGAVDLATDGPTRLGISAVRGHVGDGVTTLGFEEVALHVTTQPRAVLKLDGAVGATRLDAVGPEPASVIPTGQLRARWRAPQARAAVDLRAQRSVLDATPLLLTNHVVRTEAGGILELPIARSLSVRGIGRLAALSDSAEVNHRTAVGGVLAVALTPALEISGQVHQVHFAHPTEAGYFAPRLAQVAEVGSYFEIETPGSALFACDLGVGAQRVAEQGAPVGPWRRAFHLYALVSVRLAPGRELRLEVEGEDSPVAHEAATTAPWRYGSAGLSLRWAMP